MLQRLYLHPEDAEHSIFPNGLNSFIDRALAAEMLLPEESEQIFDTISNALKVEDVLAQEENVQIPTELKGLLEEAKAGRHRVVWSYARLAITHAHKAMKRDGPTRLEDYVQSGIEGLYVGVDKFARLDKEKRQFFAPFARLYIDNAIRQQWLRDIYGTEPESWVVNVMYAYLKTLRQTPEERTEVDITALSKEVGASREAVLGVIALFATHKARNALSKNQALEKPDNFLYEEAAPARSEIAMSSRLELALLLLSPMQRYTIERLYGLVKEEPNLTLDEMATIRGISAHTFNTFKNQAIGKLRDILQNMDSFGLDFSKWPEEGARYLNQGLNVLTYLHRTKLCIPQNKSVRELCIMAMQDVSRRHISDQHKRMIADMYGLHNGARLTIAQLMEKYGYSSAYFSQVAKKVMTAPYEE